MLVRPWSMGPITAEQLSYMTSTDVNIEVIIKKKT